MSNTPTKEELRKFMVQNFMLDEDMANFGDQDSFLQKGIIDSMGMIELMQHLTKQYGVQIKRTEMIPDNFDSLDQLNNYVLRKLVDIKEA
jgi:acyl carrier protein